MQIPQAPMEKQQMMLSQQVTGQRQDRSSNTVHQSPLHNEDGIHGEWMSDSSDEEPCVLATSLEVDQRGPYVRGKVMGHRVSFLVDTGATRSTVRSAEVPTLPLSSRTVQVVGVAIQYLTNLITDPVHVEVGNFQGLDTFVVCHSNPVSLLGRDLLRKTKCSITCANDGIEIQANSDDEKDQAPEIECENTIEEYPLMKFFPMFTVKELHPDLQGTVQENVWDLTGKEVGLIKGVEPVKVTIKPNAVFPQLPQYKMTQYVLTKVAQIIADFVKQGVLKEVLSSPCNSPMMGLKKPCGKVRIVQNLRKTNEIVVKCCPVVPNPAVILFQIPCDAEWFMVIDLCHKHSFLCLFMRIANFPFVSNSWIKSIAVVEFLKGIFDLILKKNLATLEFPFQSTLVQYIDDLLIAYKTRDECMYDTIALLNHLGKNGQKVSPLKLQYCQKVVNYLGHQTEKGLRKISRERITTILQISPQPHREMSGCSWGLWAIVTNGSQMSWSFQNQWRS
ncbi:hypothetical protein NDU88_006353 [Pleurodeles waltl]|uniref:ribonuclease H n=1 Tax=Pleurodeles waltl TaxID=8319 RepID=A0AAV7MYY0_PLEWA|nr:hypothetical protein NDU88_006353 [Pleurodeles waltl]